MRSCAVCGKELKDYQKRCCSNKCFSKVRHKPIGERFWARLKIKDSGCWIWPGGKYGKGYGTIVFGKKQATHRVAWILTNGPIPDGLFVLHKCDCPSCCRPDHLWLGTAADNSRDMIQKGRTNGPAGERSGFAKLTNEDVIEIRRLRKEGVSCRSITLRFPVCRKTIEKIIAKTIWRHLP